MDAEARGGVDECGCDKKLRRLRLEIHYYHAQQKEFKQQSAYIKLFLRWRQTMGEGNDNASDRPLGRGRCCPWAGEVAVG